MKLICKAKKLHGSLQSRSKECLFEKLSLDFEEGWRVLVHGPSGVGKSSLAFEVLTTLAPQKGVLLRPTKGLNYINYMYNQQRALV